MVGLSDKKFHFSLILHLYLGMKKALFFCLFLLSCLTIWSQTSKGNAYNKQDTVFLEKLMQSKPELFKHILTYPDSFQVQIVYTQINRDAKNKPSFKEYAYHLGKQYFYPASTVKMPIAFLALQKLKDLDIKGLDRNTTMVTDSAYPGQTMVYNQPNSIDGRATIENYVKQIFLVSDNDAFNRLYEFLGQEYIQQLLIQKGYPEMAIRHRLDVSMTADQNRATNPILFYDSSSKPIYQQAAQYSKAIFPKKSIQMGKGFYKNGQLINSPFDFSEKNNVPLINQHHILQSVLFPESVNKKQRFQWQTGVDSFVLRWMSSFPRESRFPNYDTGHYWDTYCKFLLYGSEKVTIPSSVRIFNKVGDAYGFLTDIAYVVDFDNHVEFLVSATISCNSDGIYNDDKYDYDRIGYPFLKNLGQLLLDYEKTRERRFLPDLSKFQMIR
jgi:Beta-lactamase enzyme family